MSVSPENKKQCKRFLENEETFATVLLLIFVDKYGMKSLSWDPETIRMELEEDFDATLPRKNIDKLMTAIMALTTNRFYKSLPDFINMCNIFSGDVFDPRVFDPADARECAWGLTELIIIYPPEEEEEGEKSYFFPEIVGYIKNVIRHEGMIKIPESLRIFDDGNSDFATIPSFEDPEELRSVWESNNKKVEEVDNEVLSRLEELSNQLRALNLENGNTETIVHRLESTIKKYQRSGKKD